jgi:hypothetical protein
MKELDKIDEKKDFMYSMKLRTAIIGFILFLFLSSPISYKVLQTIFNNFYDNQSLIINEKNNPTFFSKLIMASIIAIILFIF